MGIAVGVEGRLPGHNCDVTLCFALVDWAVNVSTTPGRPTSHHKLVLDIGENKWE